MPMALTIDRLTSIAKQLKAATTAKGLFRPQDIPAKPSPQLQQATKEVDQSLARAMLARLGLLEMADLLARKETALTAAEKRATELAAMIPPQVAEDVDAALAEPDEADTIVIPSPAPPVEALQIQALKASLAQVTAQLQQAERLASNARTLLGRASYQPATEKVLLGGKFYPIGHYSTPTATLLTDLGTKRKANEDTALFARLTDGREVYIVADGMGGHDGGEFASISVADSFLFALESGLPLEQAVSLANYQTAISAPKRGSGSTLVAAIVDRQKNTLQVVQVGDSRVKFVEPGQTLHLTLDHKLKTEVYFQNTLHGKKPDLPINEGQIIAFDNYKFEHDNIITAAMGATNLDKDGVTVKPPEYTNIVSANLVPTKVSANLVPTNEKSYLLLYSDGAIDHVSETELTGIARQEGLTHEQIAYEIQALALKSSKDNITIIVVEIPATIGTASHQCLTGTNMPVVATASGEPPQPVNHLAEKLKRLTPEQQAYFKSELDYTRLNADQIAAQTVQKQLIIVHEKPLHPNVRQKAMARLWRNNLDSIVKIWRTSNETLGIAAQKVLISYLENNLQNAESNNETFKQAAAWVKQNKARPLLEEIIKNPSNDYVAGAAERVLERAKRLF